MDERLLEHFKQSVVAVFISMVKMKIRLKSTSKSSEANGYDYDVNSIVRIDGDLKGFVAVRMKEQLGAKITESLCGMKPEGLDEMLLDSIGEIANMVAGGAKKKFVAEGIKYSIGIPSTTVEKNIKELEENDSYVLNWVADDDTFAVQVYLNKVN